MKLHLLPNKIIFLFLLLVLFTNRLQAQQKGSFETGAKIMIEANSSNGGTMPFTGLQLVYKKGKHNGLETGLYYRPLHNEFIVMVNNGTTNFTAIALVAERLLSIPVLFRYHTKFINFSAGASVDFFLGWKDKSDKNVITINSYHRSNGVDVGAIAAINKDFLLGKKLVIEPEIRFNQIFTNGNTFLNSAFGVAFRYKL